MERDREAFSSDLAMLKTGPGRLIRGGVNASAAGGSANCHMCARDPATCRRRFKRASEVHVRVSPERKLKVSALYTHSHGRGLPLAPGDKTGQPRDKTGYPRIRDSTYNCIHCVLPLLHACPRRPESGSPIVAQNGRPGEKRRASSRAARQICARSPSHVMSMPCSCVRIPGRSGTHADCSDSISYRILSTDP